MELRPYQQQAKDAIFSEWENGIKKTLLVLPTGCGKTIVFAKVAEECVKGGSRVLILAHRGELLDQAADKIGKSTGLGCATEKAEQTCIGSWFRIVVGSVQSMMREKRLNQFPNNYFNTIIIDEAHHCISESYQKVLRHFPDAEVLGVTATPDRGDMQNLGTVFESLAYEYTLPRAIKDGYLSPIKAVTIPLKIDMSAVGVQAGDFKSGDIATALDPYLESIAEEMEKYCSDKKTVVFLPLVKTSQKFRDILNNHGFRAAEVNGDSKDRAEILEAWYLRTHCSLSIRSDCMNVSYEYYKDSFGGSLIPESRWNSLEIKMSARLNRYTFDRMTEGAWSAKAKTALCEMCDCAYKYAQRDGKMSENNDGYSVSYDTGKSLDSMLYEIAEVYLVNTGLMSLAVDDNADECNDYNL